MDKLFTDVLNGLFNKMYRIKYITVIFYLLFTSKHSVAEANTNDTLAHKEFYFAWDNDIFLFKDFYYTQGAKLFWVHPALAKNPANHIFPTLKNADNYFGLGLIQEIYTPKDIADTILNAIDRPYAGTLYIRSSLTSVNPKKRLKISSSLDLGFLGPLSGAQLAQELIHEWTGSKPPQGWDFQIDNRPYINYNIEIEKALLSLPETMDINGTGKLRVGNIHDDLQAGFQIRAGRLNDYFKGLHLDNKKYSGNRDFQVFAFGRAQVRAVLYNATLMGGIIPPDSDHRFTFREIEHLVAEFSGGIQINWNFVSAQAKVTWKTPEFENGENHGWGTIAMYFRF
jgi:hypothetical protein